MDTKLRCTFEMPAGAENQNDLNSTEDSKITRAKHEDSYTAKSQKVYLIALQKYNRFYEK